MLMEFMIVIIGSIVLCVIFGVYMNAEEKKIRSYDSDSVKEQKKENLRNELELRIAKAEELQAAKNGSAAAQYRLGECYWFKDKAEAVRWFKKAAEQGHADAQYELGKCYWFEDKAEGMKWTKKAAEQGHVAAQRWLGECYLNGEGVPKDQAEGMKWIRKAAKAGNQNAIDTLKKLKIDI